MDDDKAKGKNTNEKVRNKNPKNMSYRHFIGVQMQMKKGKCEKVTFTERMAENFPEALIENIGQILFKKKFIPRYMLLKC